MSIHIRVYDTHGTAPYKNEQRVITLLEKEFKSVDEALNWWGFFRGMTGLQDESVKEVIEATTNEYVGTEHELTNKDGDYSTIGIAIEGTVKPEPPKPRMFEQRVPDLYVDEIINMGDGQFQLNGQSWTNDGTKKKNTWMTVHVSNKTTIRESSVGTDDDS
jgi:hypothetical protein